ncbi:actin-binding protein IPP-like isoform X2 [Oratosquilla oratoria]
MRMAACVGLLPPSQGPPMSSLGNDAHRYACKSYANKLLQNLHTLWQSEHFCDVEITAGGFVVKAHRAVLSASSAYFQAMFTGGLIEETMSTIELKAVSANILAQLIRFIYTGDIEVKVDNVQELMVAADMLEIHDVVHVCTNFLKKELHASNAVGIYRFAESHHLVEMMETSETFVHTNFPEVVTEEEFCETPREILVNLLQSEYLRIDSEFQVFSAALRWINHDITGRRRYVFEILNQVRLPLIPSRLLEKAISECCDISLKVALQSIQKDVQSKRGSLVPLYVQPRICARKKIYVIGGSKRELISSWTRSECTFESVECFDTFRKDWTRVCPMEIGRILPGIAILNGRIFVVGGEQESRILANGEVYDPQEDVWTTMASMVIPRCEFGLCAHDGFLYAFGGWVGEDIGGSIERYDPIQDEWRLESNMPEARFSMGVIAREGLIYIVGGCTHSQRHLQDLLCYNPVTGQWHNLAPMLTPRSQMGVTVLDGFLYVVGGTNRHNEVLTSVERYSFEQNKWYECTPMTVGRASPAVAATNSLLYVIGGDQTSEVNDFYRAQVTISHVEYYDPHTNRWLESTPLPESRSEAGAVVI